MYRSRIIVAEMLAKKERHKIIWTGQHFFWQVVPQDEGIYNSTWTENKRKGQRKRK